MLNYKHIPYVATAVFVLIMVLLLIYLIRTTLKEKDEERKFDKQLKYALNPLTEEEVKESYINSKLRILPEQMIKAGISKGDTVESLQRKLMLVLAVVFTGTAMLTVNPIAGIVPVMVIYGGLFGLSMYRNSKTTNLLEEQIPSFVATFKANIQANQHAQNAMVNAINNTTSPLYDELEVSKSIMEAGDFQAGILSLRQGTENETLRQMASCIELASASGSNIESQLEIIEDIIEDKQAIERKKRLGVNENKPLFIVSAIFVPGSLIGSYLFSDMHSDYWFTTPMSWFILAGVLVMMAISMFATWKVIKKVDIY